MNVRVELTRRETAVACAYDRSKRAILRAGGVAGALLLAGACSSAPPVKEMTGLELIIEVDGKVNPDDMNRAAPIEVRVYELKSSVAFEAADFYALQNDAKNTLSGDVLATDEFVLRPVQARPFAGDRIRKQRQSVCSRDIGTWGNRCGARPGGCKRLPMPRGTARYFRHASRS